MPVESRRLQQGGKAGGPQLVGAAIHGQAHSVHVVHIVHAAAIQLAAAAADALGAAWQRLQQLPHTGREATQLGQLWGRRAFQTATQPGIA